MRSGQFRLPGRKALTLSDVECRVVVVDATECPVERPQKSSAGATAARRSATPRRRRPSPISEGAGRRRSQKAQVVADLKAKQILATAFSAGRTHDFRLFGSSRTAMRAQTCCLTDSGDQGLTKQHKNSRTPHKGSKLHRLTREQRRGNRQLPRERFVIEHVVRALKVFRILSERYHNRRKRFGLRFNLIAALYNHELVD